MARDRLEKDREYVCCEQSTGQAVRGALRVTDDLIEVRLVSFDDFFFIKDEEKEYLALRLEDNSYASMHHAYFGGTGSCSSRTQVTHNQTVTASTLIHGPDEWKPDDPIKHVTFELPRADRLLRYDTKIKELESSSPWSDIETYVVTVETQGIKVRLGYRMTVSWTERVHVEAPVFAVDFQEPRSTKSYLDDIRAIVRFVSLILSLQMEPEELRIRRLSDEEMLAQVEKGDFLGDHSVTQMWFRKSRVTSRESRVHFAFAALFDEGELQAFTACLKSWLDREPDWKRSNALMVECLRLQGEISAERLLAACKWLEEIPLAQAIQVTDDSVIESIASSALLAAHELGYERLKARISQAIERLKLESHRERFDRLVRKLSERFGAGATDDQMADHLIEAIRDFRGKVAHGHYEPKSDNEYHRFIKAIFAVEALCMLLTCADLPMTEDGIRRIKLHPLVERYRLFHLN